MLCLKCCFQEEQTETLSRIEKEKQKAQNFQTRTFSYKVQLMDGWMRFYVIFNIFSFISGRCFDDNEKLVQWNLVYGWKDLRLQRGSSPGPLV